MKINYLMLVPMLDIFTSLVNKRGINTKVKEGNDLLTPIWSVDVYKIKDRYVQKHQPTLYYLDGGPKRSFVFEELQPILDP